MIIGWVRLATSATRRQPTLRIIAKVTVRTRTIDLKVLLGGGIDGDGMGICVDVDGSESLLNFSRPLDWVVATTRSMSDMIVSKVVKWYVQVGLFGFAALKVLPTLFQAFKPNDYFTKSPAVEMHLQEKSFRSCSFSTFAGRHSTSRLQ